MSLASRLALAALLALAASCATPLESVFVPNPNSGLKVGNASDRPGKGTIVEYVPADEDIATWKHLLTIQFLENERRTPRALVDDHEEVTRMHGGTLEWKVLESGPDSVVYEWRLSDCPKGGPLFQDQHEIARVLRGNAGLHRVAYTERARTMDPVRREHYLDALKKAYVVLGNDLTPVVVLPPQATP